MSSNEDEHDDGGKISKKRRIQRACDICRRKKIRCDGVQMPGNRCSNCIAYNFDCTYVEAAKKRGPPKGYVESLENRLEKMENLLHRLVPDGDFSQEIGGNFDRETWSIEKPSSVIPQPSITTQYLDSSQYSPRSATKLATVMIRRYGTDFVDLTDLEHDEDAHLSLVDEFKRLSVRADDVRFFGRSSGAMLIKTAIDLKQQVSGGGTPSGQDDWPLSLRRPEFWSHRTWEKIVTDPEPLVYTFPEPDLLHSLIDLYFKHFNWYLPLMHRPTFQRSVAEGLHLSSVPFGAVVLLVCAVASRWSNDSRVLLDGVDSWHSAGWKWFNQVQLVRRSQLQAPTVYDLQFYCLSVQFLHGTSVPQACWTMVGIGIRLAQDVGAHRRKAKASPPTVEDELWKRAFWCLVCMDRMVSSFLGRPCAIQDEDFDLEPPIECDDEYWEHPDPEQAFKQPPDKPSYIIAFSLMLKLMQLLAFTLRTVYSINKSKILLGFVGTQWEQHIVAEIDSALNRWVDSLPDHLRWDPNREDPIFFTQSASLYVFYYHIQILVHRPFIPSPKKPSPLSFPSLAICTNAARSCCHIVDAHRRKKGTPMPFCDFAAFTAGVVLLLNIWGGRRSGLSTDTNKEMADVHKCMQVLRLCEERWNVAGRLGDILAELASVGDLPLPKQSPNPMNKRERDAESPRSTPDTPLTQSSGTSDFSETSTSVQGAQQRQLAGNRRVASTSSQAYGQKHSSVPQPPAQQLFSLPMYTDELGRLPLHGDFNFGGPQQHGTNVHNPGAQPPSQWYEASAENGVPGPSTVGHAAAMNRPAQASYSMPFDTSTGSIFTGAGPGVGNAASSLGRPPDGSMFSPPSAMYPGQLMDGDAMAMWSAAPSGFELDEWNSYIAEMSQLQQDAHLSSAPR